jgi:hypothetical protein
MASLKALAEPLLVPVLNGLSGASEEVGLYLQDLEDKDQLGFNQLLVQSSSTKRWVKWFEKEGSKPEHAAARTAALSAMELISELVADLADGTDDGEVSCQSLISPAHKEKATEAALFACLESCHCCHLSLNKRVSAWQLTMSHCWPTGLAGSTLRAAGRRKLLQATQRKYVCHLLIHNMRRCLPFCRTAA